MDIGTGAQYMKSPSGLYVPPEIAAEQSIQQNPNRETRRQIMAQVRRYNRQQKRLKLRKGNA